jgi:hypothetical protein
MSNFGRQHARLHAKRPTERLRAGPFGKWSAGTSGLLERKIGAAWQTIGANVTRFALDDNSNLFVLTDAGNLYRSTAKQSGNLTFVADNVRSFAGQARRASGTPKPALPFTGRRSWRFAVVIESVGCRLWAVAGASAGRV